MISVWKYLEHNILFSKGLNWVQRELAYLVYTERCDYKLTIISWHGRGHEILILCTFLYDASVIILMIYQVSTVNKSVYIHGHSLAACWYFISNNLIADSKRRAT